jgi:signal transduction histidine kinase
LSEVNWQRQGRGFGLLIAREIAERHGGFLEVKSKSGAGTKVRLFLPCREGGSLDGPLS